MQILMTELARQKQVHLRAQAQRAHAARMTRPSRPTLVLTRRTARFLITLARRLDPSSEAWNLSTLQSLNAVVQQVTSNPAGNA